MQRLITILNEFTVKKGHGLQIKKKKQFVVKYVAPQTDDTYTVIVGQKMPSFQFWPQGVEMIDRLICKATLTKDLDSLVCRESNC
jgi:hypothetical protein